VNVGTGETETFTVGDKTYETTPVPRDRETKPTHDLIVDGARTRIADDADPKSLPKQIAWTGDTLAAITGDGRFGKLDAKGHFTPDPKLAAAFPTRIETSFVSGPDRTLVTRRYRAGAGGKLVQGPGGVLATVGARGGTLGKPVELGGEQTGIAGMVSLETAWAGDRFLFGYAVEKDGQQTARVVGMRCKRGR
jgi:hypothetical protein